MLRRTSARVVYKARCRRTTSGAAEPIWLSALFASRCRARVNGEDHAIRWECAGNRVLYTNAGRETEQIEPLGVNLRHGHTLAVSWTPGDTAYTVEVFCDPD